MTEKQKYLLKLFKEVDEICKENNLRYVMSGGSLIGAVRHEGFVPWDDDVDLYMPRSDWEKFVEICKTQLPPNRAIQCSEVDRNYTNSFPRYASTDTCAIHKSQIIGKDCGGEIIDVLTLDPIPADDKEYEKYRTHMMIYSDLINISVGYSDRWEIPASMYLKYLLSYIFLGKEKTLSKLEKIMFSYKEEECDRYAMRWGGCPFLFDKDMMFPVKYGIFEGEKVMIPNKCSDYLIWHYGDEWSYMPPHDSREGHVAVCVEDTPYQDFREEYMPKMKKGRLRFYSAARKFYNMLIAKKNHKIRQEGLEIKAASTAMDLLGALKESGFNLQEMLEQRSYKKLSRLFGSYYKTQLSADFIGREDYLYIYPFYHPVLIKIPDDVFLAAMMTLFYTERVSKAYRMLQVREKLDHLSPEMETLKKDIELFRKAANEYEFQRMEEARNICHELLKKYPEHPGLMKFWCRFLMERAGENRLEAERFLEKALKLFPNDGYFLKYKADILWMNGEGQKALELYVQVREKTSNGIVWLEMDRLFQEYKEQILENCESMIADKQKEQAVEMMELWSRLMPEDEEIAGALHLAKVSSAHTQTELEAEITEIRKKLGTPMRNPVERTKESKKVSDEQTGVEEKKTPDHETAADTENVKTEDAGLKMYRKALTRAWKRLGYPEELAQLRTEIICTGEESELEWLAEQVRNRLIHKEERAYVYKLVGDICKKQGQIKSAFENYRKALDYAKPSYVRTELYRLIINDLNNGSRQAVSFAKKTDASMILDSWLDKYGSLEDIQALASKLV